MPTYSYTGSGGMTLGGSVGSPGSVVGMSDSFGGPSGVALPSHPLESGGSWSYHPSYASSNVVISSAGRARSGGPVSSVAITSPVLASTDYDVSADIFRVLNISSEKVGVAGCVDPSSDTSYRFYYLALSDRFVLEKVTSGVVSNVTTGTTGYAGQTMSWRRRGAVIQGLLNGAVEVQFVDPSPIASPGRAGLYFSGDASDSGGYHLDNFIVSPGSPPIYRAAPAASGGMRLGGTQSPGAAYRAPASGGMRFGGTQSQGLLPDPVDQGLGGDVLWQGYLATSTVIFAGSGGMRFGGAVKSTPPRPDPVDQGLGGDLIWQGYVTASSVVTAGSGGMRFGGSTTPKSSASVVGSGGMRFGGRYSLGPLPPPIPDPIDQGLGGDLILQGYAGSRTYTDAGTGGVRFGGAAPWSIRIGTSTSGGVRFGGVATAAANYRHSPSGGMRFGGRAATSGSAQFRPSGGMRFGGSGLIPGIYYRVHANDGAGGPIDEDVTIVQTSYLSWTTSPLPYPGDYSWGVRTYSAATNLEEHNVDARVRVILDETGADVTNRPAAPSALAVEVLKGGVVRPNWIYRTPSWGAKPSEFRVYGGSPSVSFATPLATVRYQIDGRYYATIEGLTDGATYLFCVRSANATGEEKNTMTASGVPDATAPMSPPGVTISAI